MATVLAPRFPRRTGDTNSKAELVLYRPDRQLPINLSRNISAGMLGELGYRFLDQLQRQTGEATFALHSKLVGCFFSQLCLNFHTALIESGDAQQICNARIASRNEAFN